jgi:hypothetical protein
VCRVLRASQSWPGRTGSPQTEHLARPAATTSATCVGLCPWLATKTAPHLEQRVLPAGIRLPQSRHAVAVAGRSDTSPFLSLNGTVTGSGRRPAIDPGTRRPPARAPAHRRRTRLRGRGAATETGAPGVQRLEHARLGDFLHITGRHVIARDALRRNGSRSTGHRVVTGDGVRGDPRTPRPGPRSGPAGPLAQRDGEEMRRRVGGRASRQPARR